MEMCGDGGVEIGATDERDQCYRRRTQLVGIFFHLERESKERERESEEREREREIAVFAIGDWITRGEMDIFLNRLVYLTRQGPGVTSTVILHSKIYSLYLLFF